MQAANFRGYRVSSLRGREYHYTTGSALLFLLLRTRVVKRSQPALLWSLLVCHVYAKFGAYHETNGSLSSTLCLLLLLLVRLASTCNCTRHCGLQNALKSSAVNAENRPFIACHATLTRSTSCVMIRVGRQM